MPKSEASPQRLLRAVGGGCLLAAGISLVLCMLLAAMLAGETLPEDLLQPLALPVALLSALAGGTLAAKMAGGRRLPAAMAAGALYVLLLFLLRALSVRGRVGAVAGRGRIGGGAGGGIAGDQTKKAAKSIDKRQIICYNTVAFLTALLRAGSVIHGGESMYRWNISKF